LQLKYFFTIRKIYQGTLPAQTTFAGEEEKGAGAWPLAALPVAKP